MTVICPAPLVPTGTPRALVGKRGPDRSGVADLVAIVEVVDEVIVEVHGLLHETQTERVDAEVEVGLRVVDRRGDVVQAENRRAHTPECSVVPERDTSHRLPT